MSGIYTTVFKPFEFVWDRTKEINDLLKHGYVFPALTDAILLPDMFGKEYNDPSDGNTEDERHYKGWCKHHLSLYECPEGKDVTDYNLLNPNMCYKIRNYIVHGTKISANGKDDINAMFDNPQSKVGKQFDNVEFQLVSAIAMEGYDKKLYEGEHTENGTRFISSIRDIKDNKLFVAVNAFVLCLKIIRDVDTSYKEAAENKRRIYNKNYLCNRQIIVNELNKHNINV